MAKSCKSKNNNVFNLNLRLGQVKLGQVRLGYVCFCLVWYFCGAAASKAEIQNTRAELFQTSSRLATKVGLWPLRQQLGERFRPLQLGYGTQGG